ncbi:hypothetical protein [Microbulbifer variabilis]|uniref:hypothetical protein n=1 Tax=Microbulbifer variabilis TaxID=266805 RepID=UPI001CFD81A0|nr:hypothetical protein [Microbulbifer variabilis]
MTAHAQKSQSALPEHHFQISDSQYAHYTEGDGLTMLGPDREVLCFLHEEGAQVGHHPAYLQIMDSIDEAIHQLDFLSLALTPGSHLELSPEAQLGLSSILRKLRNLLENH